VPETDNVWSPLTEHTTPAGARPELPELAGRQRRIAAVAVVVVGLLVWWPVVILAAIFIVPTVIISTAAAALLAVVAMPVWLLVRHVRSRHRASQSALLPNRRGP
jgi:Flp pilus assembly protein TadB